MEIARERFLDDTREVHLTAGIRSRTTAAHSLLSGLTDEERAQVSAALVRALDEVERIVREHRAAAK
jgi:DNA-binding MarR family transcriptional regulator